MSIAFVTSLIFRARPTESKPRGLRPELDTRRTTAGFSSVATPSSCDSAGTGRNTSRMGKLRRRCSICGTPSSLSATELTQKRCGL